MNIEDARAVADVWNSRGGRLIHGLLLEHIKVPKDELFEIMVHKTGTLTGAGAHMRAGKAKECQEFLDEIEDVCESANPSRKG